MTWREHCILCGAEALSDLVEIPDAPVHCNILCASRDQAMQVPRAAIALAACQDCGHVFNRAFDPARMDYQGEYENALHFSAHFRAYQRALAERLVDGHAIRHKDVVEIGCGDGTFLDLLCRLGHNRGTGFDPSVEAERQGTKDTGHGIRIIPEYYSAAAYGRCKGDLVVCRHVLEHIDTPRPFLELLRAAMKDESAVLYLEVPNGLYTLESGHIWDIIYEHCSYFSAQSLRRALADAGFEPLRLGAVYDEQFLSTEARYVASRAAGDGSDAATAGVAAAHGRDFSDRFWGTVERWRDVLRQAGREGRRVVAWGAGSKGVTFLNLMGRDGAVIEHIVDVNPRKAGRYVPGSGQRIVELGELSRIAPDIVLLMNPVYQREVAAQLAELGLSSGLAVVGEMTDTPASVA